MRDFRSLLAAAILFLAPCAGPAVAQSAPATANVVAACGTPNGGAYTAGTNKPLTQSTGGGICPGNSSGANIGLVGGYEFNASVIPTTTNASHAAGVALNSLQTISIGSTNGLSGILTQVQYASKGGSTAGVVVYLWSANPSNTTCTNGSNFVASQADNQALIVAPILLTPALVLSAQDTTTYAVATNLVGNFVNGSSNTDIYECTVANATVTPATTTDIRINIQGVKDQP